MKKLVAFLLVLTMVSSICLTSCMFNLDSDELDDDNADNQIADEEVDYKDSALENNDYKETNKQEQDSSQTQNQGQNQNSSEGENNQNQTTQNAGFDDYTVVSISPFSEGKAFIRGDLLTNSSFKCIDKKGNILFEIPQSSADAVIFGFHNGIAAVKPVGGVSGEVKLYDDKGKEISPETVGGTYFLGITDIYGIYEKMYKDGYIFVIKNTTDFTGSVSELGIVNSKMEMLVDFSEEFYKKYAYFNNSYDYYDGLYIRKIKKDDEIYVYTALNLKNGKETEYSTLEELYKSENIVRRASDDWVAATNGYKNGNGELVLDLSQYTNAFFGDFVNGLAYVTFKVQESTGKAKYYFTVIDETGKFKFEPVELKGDLNYSGYTGYQYPDVVDKLVTRMDEDSIENSEYYGKFIVTTIMNGNKILTTFDMNGKVAEKEVGKWYNDFMSDELVVGDGLIISKIENSSTYYSYKLLCYDFNLNKQ